MGQKYFAIAKYLPEKAVLQLPGRSGLVVTFTEFLILRFGSIWYNTCIIHHLFEGKDFLMIPTTIILSIALSAILIMTRRKFAAKPVPVRIKKRAERR